ncbi:hypothetical protein Cylst_1825 [Cylindrospermum stagnale PCC 7417]|uniref:Uncharacterized protein n=1 Tax=Cylindrospermum stagnale PCC 7417 TaxID=56107 RepID=K9WWB1_9NOST|nr:hypothetical protein Cylst_1825 [Cylindrospermum stagnale PCC 7417]
MHELAISIVECIAVTSQSNPASAFGEMTITE